MHSRGGGNRWRSLIMAPDLGDSRTAGRRCTGSVGIRSTERVGSAAVWHREHGTAEFKTLTYDAGDRPLLASKPRSPSLHSSSNQRRRTRVQCCGTSTQGCMRFNSIRHAVCHRKYDPEAQLGACELHTLVDVITAAR